MAASKKKKLPSDFDNPFQGRNPDEVWQELRKNAKPISREEMLNQIEEQTKKRNKKKEKASDKNS